MTLNHDDCFLMDFSPFLVKCHFSTLSVREFVILPLTNFYVWKMLFDIPLQPWTWASVYLWLIVVVSSID